MKEGDTHVHSVTAGRLLAGVTLSKSPVKGVGESVFLKVWQLLIVDLESGPVRGVDDGVGGEGLNGGWLVGLGIDELVVDDLDVGVLLRTELQDLVRNRRRISEGRDVLADTSKVQNDVVGVRTAELGLGLLAENHDIDVWLLEEFAADELGHAGVDTTAQALVGGSNDDQSLLVALLERLGLGLVENGVGGLSVRPGVLHGTGRSVQLRGGHNLHGVGDLLDVADGLETILNLTKSREGGGIWGDGAIERRMSV